MDRIHLTPKGLERLYARIAEARAAYRAVCDDMPAALESGDTSGWHDNFAFEENQRQMHQLAKRVQELEGLLARVVVVEPLSSPPDQVRVGSVVTWSLEGGAPRSLCIAGYDDGDPSVGRVSYDSPLARQLLGAAIGDVRKVHIAGSAREIEILDIGPTAEGV
jgi:transcription elongation GreA/GreB family factor